MRYREYCERLTCQHKHSPPKSSPPPLTATSSRRPALTPRSQNSVRSCPVVSLRPPPRRKHPPGSARNSVLPPGERWRWRKRQDGPKSKANPSHQRHPPRKLLNQSAGSAKKVWQGSSPPQRSDGVYRRPLRKPPQRRPLRKKLP